MGIATGNFEVQCLHCGNQNSSGSNEAEFKNVGSEDKSMGVQIEYAWKTSLACIECSNEIKIHYHVWEYPQGALNDEDISISGGRLVSGFGYDFHDAPEPDEDDI